MNRLMLTLGSAVCVLGAALLVGGKGGLVGGSVAILLLTAGALFGIPAFVTAAGAAIIASYLAALVLQQSPLDLGAPIIAMVVLACMELGHLSLDGARYSLPGGTLALAIRAGFTALACITALGICWVVLLGLFWLPGAGATLSSVVGVAAILAVFALLIALSRESQTA